MTGVLYTYFLGIANYEQFQIGVSIDYLAMIIIGGLGSVLGSIFGAIFVTLLPIGIRYAMEAFGGLFFSQQTVLNLIPNLRLMLFGALIIVLPDRGARGAEPAVAEYPQLFPRLAVRVLSVREEGERSCIELLAIVTALLVVAWPAWARLGPRASPRARSSSACSATAPGRPRSSVPSCAPACTTTSPS